MADYYDGKKQSQMYGSRLIIFKRRDVGDNYWFRAKIDGQNGYIRRSCKTANADEAMRIALAAYEVLRIRQLGHLSLTTLTVEKFFAEWIGRKRHNFTASRAQWIESVFDRYMAGYFGKQNISELTKKFVDGYWEYRLNVWNSEEGQSRIELNDKRIGAKSKSSHNVARVPAFNTLRAEASLINQWLSAAVDDGHLQRSIKISAQDAIAKSERGDGYRAVRRQGFWNIWPRDLAEISAHRFVDPMRLSCGIANAAV